jgi:NAD-dependent SIR2 family protein deacetylase
VSDELDTVLREILTHNEAYEWSCSTCGIARPDGYADEASLPSCPRCGSEEELIPPPVLWTRGCRTTPTHADGVRWVKENTPATIAKEIARLSDVAKRERAMRLCRDHRSP